MDKHSEKKHLFKDDQMESLCQQNVKGFLIVLPLMTLGSLCMSQLNTVSNQLIYKMIGDTAQNGGSPSLEVCDLLQNGTDDSVQAESIYFGLIMKIGAFTGAMISLPILGALSDYKGRHVSIIAVILGLILYIVAMLAVSILQDTPLWILVVGDTLHGLLGRGSVGLFMLCAAIITDKIQTGKRTFLMISTTFIFYLTSAATGIGAGYWIKIHGFTPFLIASLSFSIALLFYSMCILPNLVNKTQQSNTDNEGNLVLQKIRKYFIDPYATYFKKRDGYVRSCLVLNLIYMLIQSMAIIGLRNLIIIYSLGPPLCWDASVIGLYSAVEAICKGFIPMLFGICTINQEPSPWLVFLGQLGTIIGSVIYGFARTTPVMIVGVVFFSSHILVPTVSWSLVGDMVLPTEQGVVMSGQVTIEMMGGLLANLLYNSFYVATVSTCRRCFFFLSTILCSLGILLIGCFAFVRRRHFLQYNSLPETVAESDDK